MARYPRQDDPKGKNVIPSVTEIISDCTNSSGALTQWAANMCKEWILDNADEEVYKPSGNVPTKYIYKLFDHELDDMRFNFRKVSQKALDIGSEVHNAVEKHLQGKPFKLTTKEAENAFKAFLQWADENKLQPVSLEQTVYGDGWAGTLDFDGYFNGERYIIDWKSSKSHYPEMRYQVAAYRHATDCRVMNDFEYGRPGFASYIKDSCPRGCGVLRLDKETGLPDWKDTSKTYEQDLEIFNAMVDLYFKRHPRIAKKARG